MELLNLRIRKKSWLLTHTKLVQRYVLMAFLLLMVWTPQAAAIAAPVCSIFTSPPVSATVNPSAVQGFTVILLQSGASCAAANLTFSIIGGDTTGGVVLPATITGATFSFTGNPQAFNVTAGPIGGGTAIIQVNCSSCTGTPFVQFTLNTTNVFTFTPTTPTSITTNQSKPFTLGTNLLVNGSPGFGYPIDFFTMPSGPSLGTPVADGAGNASVTTQIYTSGTQNIEAKVVCPISLLVPGCPPAPVPFTVVVEPVVLTAVSTNTPTFSSGGNTTMIARYGGTVSVVNPGYVINWSITASPAGGDGVLSGITTTNAAGQSQAGFTATVPGNYTVVASRFADTWSGDSSETYIITVTAIVKTLTVSSGDGQSAPTSAPLPAQLVALAQNNAVNTAGVTINWAVVSGSAAVTSPTSVTGAGGLGSMTVTLGPTPGPIPSPEKRYPTKA